MKLVRRQFLGCVGAALALPVTSRIVLAQAAPQPGLELLDDERPYERHGRLSSALVKKSR